MSEFHFLRPWWLLAMVPATALAWHQWKSQGSSRAWKSHIAPHLLPHLTVGRNERSRIRPVHALFVAWLLGTCALAGPAWQRETAPFAEETAALVIVLKVAPSMDSQDVQPTRQARAAEKIHELLAARPGAKAALIAYAGTAHRVMPLTADAGIIDSFAGELKPDVMPVEGSSVVAALRMAEDTLKTSGRSGWILWIADAASATELPGLKQYAAERRAPISVLAVAGEGPERESLHSAAQALNAPLIRVTPDSADVEELRKNTRFSNATDVQGGERWRDFGYWMLSPLALVSLAFFRRGWMMRSAGRGS